MLEAKEKGTRVRVPSDCQKSLAEFAAKAANQVKTVFGRGVYVDENTYQAACVEVVR